MEFSTLNWVEDSILDDAFDDVFTAKYESFLMNDEPKYDIFEFDDLYSTADCLVTALLNLLMNLFFLCSSIETPF